ncbi:hypothetical protein [Amycolatopsis cihanbeyliensis]|uniref:hypothetical protein n=1 Tax=Amycolatopsis cihanbeyliensis TaxID=1128664 RepID=UPI001152FAAE|nr:hypothetical protein [Amycolatopsis cihanbeyliensis]
MSAEELADYTAEFLDRCTSRIVGVGQEQYACGSHQQFEALHPIKIVDYALEEVEDLANYAAMQHIRLRRIRSALEGIL